MWLIHPSRLESYRAFKYDLYGTSTEDFLNQVKGVFVPSQAMKVGTAIHRILENPYGEYALDFEESEVEQLKEISLQIPQGVSELYVKLVIGDIQFNMSIDRMVGKQVHEIKTGKQFHGVESYESSVQWKLYVLGTGAQSATYHCITYGEKKPVTFKYHHPFTFYPYRGMQKELLDLTNDFIEFYKYHKVESFIQVKEK
jgi:hypothetical protein